MPNAIPMRLLMNRKLAEAVARIVGRTMCWTAVMTGPSQASASICPTVNSSHAIHRFGANSPSAKVGAVMMKHMAGISA